MNPMRAVANLDLSNRNQNALPIRREYRNFLANHNLETTWTGCTSSPSTRKYDAFVVVLIFNAVGVTLEQDIFTTDMSELAANFGGGKQFNKLTSNSSNMCRPEKETLLTESEREFLFSYGLFLSYPSPHYLRRYQKMKTSLYTVLCLRLTPSL